MPIKKQGPRCNVAYTGTWTREEVWYTEQYTSGQLLKVPVHTQGARVPLRVAPQFSVQLHADSRPLPMEETRRQRDVPPVRRDHQARVAVLRQRSRSLEGRRLHAGERRRKRRRRSERDCRLRRLGRTVFPLGHNAARADLSENSHGKHEGPSRLLSVSLENDVAERKRSLVTEQGEDSAIGGGLAAFLCVACEARTKTDLALESSVFNKTW